VIELGFVVNKWMSVTLIVLVGNFWR